VDLGDIENLCIAGAPDVAPDGSFAVFATTRPHLAANIDVGQIWRVELPDGRCRPLTRGIADREPRISPDGTRMAFLRRDSQGQSQVHVVEAGGGEPIVATQAPLGVQEFVWSPHGDVLAYVARVPEPGRYGTDGTPPRSESPRRITSVRWKADALGYIADRPAHVFVVPAPDLDAEPQYPWAPGHAGSIPSPTPASGLARQLSSGQHSHTGVCFSPEGTHVYCIVDLLDESDHRDLRSIVLAIAVDGSGTRELLTRQANLAVTSVCVDPDSSLILLAHPTADDGTCDVAPPVNLWRLADQCHTALSAPDELDAGEVGTQAVAFSGGVLVQNRSRGRLPLVLVDQEGTVHEQLGGDVEVLSYASAGGQIVASVATSTSPGDIVLATPAGPRALTSFSRLLGGDITIPCETTVAGRDGYPIHGWVHLPEGVGPHPVILTIHGGPHSSFGIRVSEERQVLVSAGYAVVYCNPRGSAGYGLTHARAVRHALGTVDLHDVLDFLDAALAAQPTLDSDRMGIMGGSYGGFLTAWTIAHDHRFRAAIVERGFLDPESFRGSSDIGSSFVDQYLGTDPSQIARQSALALVNQVRTPTLVIHSEDDQRCPLEQGTGYYSALKRQGTATELLLFPGEHHGLGRGGQPRHRVQRLEAILDWWQRYLSPSGQSSTVEQQ